MGESLINAMNEPNEDSDNAASTLAILSCLMDNQFGFMKGLDSRSGCPLQFHLRIGKDNLLRILDVPFRKDTGIGEKEMRPTSWRADPD